MRVRLSQALHRSVDANTRLLKMRSACADAAIMTAPFAFFVCRLRTSVALLVLLLGFLGMAGNLYAEGEPAADSDGYVWRDKEGKTLISNRPRDASGAPIQDPAAALAGKTVTAPVKGFYQWTDADGVVHLTDRFEKIPAERRDTSVFQPLPEPNFFDIELSPEVRALLRQEQAERLPKKWIALGGLGFGVLLVSFVFWRRHRKLQPEEGAFAKRKIDGDAESVAADGALGAGDAQSAEAKLAAHYKLIGVEPNALSSEVRKAYYQRIREYHPDKVASLGAELRALAEAKSREINEAYEAILFYRGEA